MSGPASGVIDIPFAFTNISKTYEVFDGPFGQKMAADIEKKTGMHVLGFGDSGGFFNITNSKRPIHTPEDMKGLKIRTMGLDTHKAIISAMGGQPAAIAWSEVYTALQTGVADGQMNPIPIIAFAKFDEVQEYLSITNHVITPYVWFINADFYKGLKPAHQEIIDWASEVASEAGRGVSRVIEASEKGLPKLSKKMKVNAVPAAELKKFAAL